MLPAIIGFVVNSGAIYFGARAAKQEANIVQCAFIALISVVTVLVAKLLLTPLAFIPVLGWFAGGLAVWAGTTLAVKFVLNLDWRPAAQIGGVVAIVQFFVSMLFRG